MRDEAAFPTYAGYLRMAERALDAKSLATVADARALNLAAAERAAIEQFEMGELEA